MRMAERLRVRFLTAISGGAVLVALLPTACSTTTKEDLEPECSTGKAEVVCYEPGTTHTVSDGKSTMPHPDPHFDGKGCQVMDEVRDGCCNAAATGPELIDGKCCYGFCTGSCCGRALLVAGEQRVAPAASRADWLEPVDVSLAGLSESDRRELAERWLQDALLEHASIASFARFTLDLLAFGVPSELVEGAQLAMADEIAHAKVSFAIASAYAGRRLGPGPLAVDGVQPSSNLAEAAAAAVSEGCVSETIAALTASQRAEATSDPVVRAALERIASDEAGHAELAWRFVQWALASGGPAVSHAVRSAWRGPETSELDEVELSAWREVIEPVAAHLA
jgi:hypothetical protein